MANLQQPTGAPNKLRGDFVPNFTQIPNVLLDHMAEVDPYSFKVLVFVCRKTFGWQKKQDRISLTQFEQGTGLSRDCLVDHLRDLERARLLVRERSSKGDLWSLNSDAKWSAAATSSPGLLVAPDYQTSSPGLPVSGSRGLPTKETIKETIQKNKTCDPSDRGQTSTLPGLSIMDQNPSNENFPSEEEKPGTAIAVVKPRKEADPRHTPFRKILEDYWAQANPNTPDLPWEGRDAKALSEFLSANPRLDEMQFRGLLQNRARSAVTHGDRVYRWIGNLTQYQEPLNQYNRPARTMGDKRDGNYAERKQQTTNDSTRAAVEYFETRDRVGAAGY